MNIIVRCLIPLVPILAATTVAAVAPIVPDSPCTISFNGYALHSLHLNPYDIRNVPLLLAAVADSLPPGYALTRAQDELNPLPDESDAFPDIVPAAVTVTIPSSVHGANDFIAVGQLRSHELWRAAAHEAPGVLKHLAHTVEKTRLNVLAAYGRPVSVYISMPGFAMAPPR